MKRLSILILFVFPLFSASAQSSLEDTLKSIVRLETESFSNRDSVTWKSLMLQDKNAFNSFTSNTYNSILIGWDSISKPMLSTFKERKTPSKYKREPSNFIIKASDKVAWLSYDQLARADGSDTLPDFKSREFRTLEKINGQWKISAVSTISTDSFTTTDPQNTEYLFNATGYNFLNEKKIKEAIKIFELNVSLFPKAWNTYDSLGEAYAAAGDKKKAILNYEQSIKLNPKNDNGIAILKKLKAK
jgi:tetratricopeptide (TPR) repeat protein